MNDKIVVWINVELIHFGIAKFLKERYECDLYGIIDIQDKTVDFFKKQQLVDFKKIWFYRENITAKKEPDLKYLSDFESKYGINLWNLVYSERIFYEYNQYYKFEYSEILSILEQECRYFEKIFQEVIPDYFLITTYAEHQSHLFYQMCRKMGTKVLMLMPTRQGYRAMIAPSLNDLELQKTSSNNATTNENIQNYFQKHNASKHQDETTKWLLSRMKKNQSLKSLARFLIKFCNDDYRKFYGNYGKTRTKILKNQVLSYSKKQSRQKFIDENFKKVVNNETNFVYFPLHVEPERTTLFDAPFYSNQFEVIKTISKSLPIQYKLYVKEHPTMKSLGWRDISYYQKILDLPNVEFIHPDITSEEILKNCSLVITVNGTVGLEAVYFGKPSITFVNASYSFLPSVTVLNKIEELPKTIRESLDKDVDKNSVCEYIRLIEENSFDFDLPKLRRKISDIFYPSGLGNETVSEDTMKRFLEKNSNEFELLALEHIKKIKQYKQTVYS